MTNDVMQKDAWINEWIDAWGDRVTQFAYTYTGDWPWAQDIAQETFLRLYQMDQSQRSTVHPGWLFTVARNLFMDEARRRKRALLVPWDDQAVMAPDQEGLRILVRDVIDRMDSMDRQCLWLFYYADYSNNEIARALGRKSSWVRTRLLRARNRFARLWEES